MDTEHMAVERKNTNTCTAFQGSSLTRGSTLRTIGTLAARLDKYMGGAAGQNDDIQGAEADRYVHE